MTDAITANVGLDPGGEVDPLAEVQKGSPNPTRLPRALEHDQVADYQRVCASRPACLRTAAMANWPGLSCSACSAWTPPSPTDLDAERTMLAQLGEALGEYHWRRDRRGNGHEVVSRGAATRVLELVRSRPEGFESRNAIYRELKGNQYTVLRVIAELFETGDLVTSNGRIVASEPDRGEP